MAEWQCKQGVTVVNLKSTIRTRTPETGLLLLALALRLWNLTGESFWHDEAYSVWIARLDWRQFLFLDVPGWSLPVIYTGSGGGLLYHILLKLWLVLGEGDWVVRFLSVLVGVLCVAMVAALGHRLYGRRAGWLAAFLLAVSSWHLWYSQEARPYPLLSLLPLASTLFLWRAGTSHRRGDWAGYILFTALGPYNHAFAWFTWAGQNLWAAYLWLQPEVAVRGGASRRDWFWHWLRVQVAVFTLTLPGLIGFWGQSAIGWWDWIGRQHGAPGLSDLLSTVAALSFGTTLPPVRWLYWGGIALTAGLVAYGVLADDQGRLHWRVPLRSELVLVICWLVAPVVIAFVLAQTRPLYVVRYLVCIQPAWVLLAGRGLSRLPSRWLLAGALAGLLLVNGVSLYYHVQTPQKEDWRGAAAFVHAQRQPGELLIFVDEDIQVAYDHYDATPGERVGASRFETDAGRLDRFVQEWQVVQRGAWLIESHHEGNRALAEALGRVAQPVLSQTFRGIQITHFGLRKF